MFSQELKILSKGNALPRSNHLLCLTPVLDSDNLLRLGDRLQSSLLSEDVKHPLILSRNSPLTSLIITDAHQWTMHGNAQMTLSLIRQTCWIIGG